MAYMALKTSATTSTLVYVLFHEKCISLNQLVWRKVHVEEFKLFESYSRFLGRGRTNAFGVYIGHKICHRVLATNASAALLSRPAMTMSSKVLYIEQIKQRLNKCCLKKLASASCLQN